MNLLGRIVSFLTQLSLKYLPDSFSIAIILTIFVFLLGVFWAGAKFFDCITYWGQGFWDLLSFAMQMCLIMFTGSLIAQSPYIKKILQKISHFPKNKNQAIFFMAFISLFLGYIHWGLSLVLSSLMIRYFARNFPDINYPLLTVSAYMGVGCTFHAGLSASAPLLVATEGNFLQKDLGIQPISLKETIFSPFNIALLIIVIIVLLVLITILAKKTQGEKARIENLKDDDEDKKNDIKLTFSDHIEKGGYLNRGIAIAGIIYLVLYFSKKGLSFDLNIVNFTFIMIALLLHPSPYSIGKASVNAGRIVHGIILQFPFYAGMYGIIKGAGLTNLIGNLFVSISNKETFPLLCLWYSGLLNYFIPSGGSKWAVEAPYILHAGDTLGVNRADVIISYAWGDMSSNIIQPFWAIPILAIANLSFKSIAPYGSIIFLVYITTISLGFFTYYAIF